MSIKTPRVNSAMLGDYNGRTVRLIGKVLKLDGETALVEASDNGQVTIKLNRDSNFSDEFVEIIGRVTNETTLTELTSYNLGGNIDMSMVEAVVKGSHKYSHMFHAEDGGGQQEYY